MELIGFLIAQSEKELTHPDFRKKEMATKLQAITKV